MTSEIESIDCKVYEENLRLSRCWACEARGLELTRFAPRDVGQYFDGLRKLGLSVATGKQHLAGVRHFFDGTVTRHAVLLNPALPVRGECYEVFEGQTPEIS